MAKVQAAEAGLQPLSIDTRINQLESAVAQLNEHFIRAGLRPNLGTSPLAGEPGAQQLSSNVRNREKNVIFETGSRRS